MTRATSFMLTIGRRFLTLQKGILIVASLFLVIDVFAEVLLRYVFKHPIFGTDELASLVAVWVYFIGAAYATQTRTHIEGSFVSAFVKKQVVVDSVRLVVLIFTLIICVMFAYMSYDWCIWTIENNVQTTSLFFPTIYGEIAMLIGAILMIIYFSIEVVEITYKLRQSGRGRA